MKRNDVELMAPAGSYDSLAAAAKSGADSVYFGLDQLNMRAASSNNFNIQDLNKIVTFCRKNKIKSYLTLNVVVYDNEIDQMQKIIDAAAEEGVSAIIASDQAVINYASLKGMEIHISTQLNISNVDTLRFYSKWADVVVLARELNLDHVEHICDRIREYDIRGPGGKPVKIEMFAHGALCMAISGKCYLSLHENNRSANRGVCYQTCRKSYIVTEKETGYELEVDNEYIMSPKDLCTIGFIDRIINSGVSILKIEGRARSAEYVKTVTECYHEALIALSERNYNAEKVEGWKKRLSTVFNRGFWDGFYLGRKMGEWTDSYGSSATKRRIYLGKITNYFKKINVAEIKLENGDLRKGDTLIITGPTTGALEYLVSEIRVDLKETDRAMKGEYCSIKTDETMRRADKVYKWVDASQVKKQ